MVESVLRQPISWLLRHSRSQTQRCVKYPQHSRRNTATAAAEVNDSTYDEPLPWTPHTPTPVSEAPSSKSRLDALKASNPRTFSSFLTDTHSRQHTYLRISLTEKCNLRCVYCMPENGVPLSPDAHLLTTPEIVHLSSLFVSEGVNKIRLTGGEPTVRKDIVPLMHQLGNLRSRGLKELCITTNGLTLMRKLDSMAEAGLTGVNLSLDTLDPFQFQIMTRRKGHDRVVQSIDRILEMNRLGAGIKLKINIVVMRNINDREILDFVELGREKDLEVRFIEYMPFDGNKWSQGKMVPFQEMLDIIREKYPDLQKVQDHKNDTSKTYQVPGFAGKMGFITSMTHNFCGTCNRLRITSDGNLKVCLFGNSEVSLRDILRENNNGEPVDEEAMEALRQLESTHQRDTLSASSTDVSALDSKLLDVIGMAVKRKKAAHAGMGELKNMKNRPMILIDNMQSRSTTSHRKVPTLPSAFNRLNPSWTPLQAVPVHLLPNPTSRPLSSIRCFSTNPSKRYDEKPSSNPPSGREPSLPSAAHTKPNNHPPPSNNEPTPPPPPLTFTHLTPRGTAHMVDISPKSPTTRLAKATATVLFSNPEPLRLLLEEKSVPKGDALAVARIGGIMAVKKTAELIVLAHPSLAVESCSVDVEILPAATASNSNNNSNNSGNNDPREEEEGEEEEARNANVASAHAPFGGILITSTVSCSGKTGIEMEALTSATVAALNVVDMVKGVDRAVHISSARIVEKRGGKSGTWRF